MLQSLSFIIPVCPIHTQAQRINGSMIRVMVSRNQQICSNYGSVVIYSVVSNKTHSASNPTPCLFFFYQVDLKDDKKIFFLRNYPMQILHGTPIPEVIQQRSGLWSIHLLFFCSPLYTTNVVATVMLVLDIMLPFKVVSSPIACTHCQLHFTCHPLLRYSLMVFVV